MGIPEGSILSSISGDEAVKVLSERTVSYKDEEMSLSKATQMAREIDYPVGPCPYWNLKNAHYRKFTMKRICTISENNANPFLFQN